MTLLNLFHLLWSSHIYIYSLQETSQDGQEIEGQETQKKYTAEIADEGLSIPEDVKTIDLSKPIEVTDSTEIIIKGKKCVLMPNPDTGQLCAYPVVPPLGIRPDGRLSWLEGKYSICDFQRIYSILSICLFFY